MPGIEDFVIPDYAVIIGFLFLLFVLGLWIVLKRIGLDISKL